MPHRARCLLVLALAFAGALPAHAGRKKAAQAETSEAASPGASLVETPAELQPAIAEAARRGRAMWELDKVAAFASDSVKDWLAIDPRLSGGWVSLRQDATFFTVWPGKVDGQTVGLYGVSFFLSDAHQELNVPPEASAAALPRPFALSEPVLARVKALEAAMGASFERLAPQYNPVVLPADGGWTVYLLPGNTDPNVIVVGGVVRIEVSAEGAVTAVKPLSKTIMRLPRPGSGGLPADTVASLPIVTELGPLPTEAHVFASLLYETPMIVLTGTGAAWYVQGEQVRMVKLD